MNDISTFAGKRQAQLAAWGSPKRLLPTALTYQFDNSAGDGRFYENPYDDAGKTMRPGKRDANDQLIEIPVDLGGNYGALEPPVRVKDMASMHPRLVAVCLSLLLPWLIFCIMSAVMTFSMHFDEKVLCCACVFTCFLLVVAIVKLAADSVIRYQSGAKTDPKWLVFLAVACFVAWGMGVFLGDLNYYYNMEPYYALRKLMVYEDVDPSKKHGQQYMDAGRMTFVKGSHLERKKAMAFKNVETYCVAPIVSYDSNKTQATKEFSYDFWAVGMNCCSDRPGSFRCGEYHNVQASSGLRIVHEEQRDFYKLAASQAAAWYGINVRHPLFFYWVQDASAELAIYMDEGLKYYYLGVALCFFVLFIFMLLAAAIFSKMS